MTRINAGIEPENLTDQHLMAEYRELPMVPAALRRSLRTKTVEQVLQSIPSEFTLNTGHVKFFYNKLTFLKDRYYRLKYELVKRGYNIDLERSHGCDGFPAVFYNHYQPTVKGIKIISERIAERIAQKPEFYRHNGKKVNFG